MTLDLMGGRTPDPTPAATAAADDTPGEPGDWRQYRWRGPEEAHQALAPAAPAQSPAEHTPEETPPSAEGTPMPPRPLNDAGQLVLAYLITQGPQVRYFKSHHIAEALNLTTAQVGTTIGILRAPHGTAVPGATLLITIWSCTKSGTFRLKFDVKELDVWEAERQRAQELLARRVPPKPLDNSGGGWTPEEDQYLRGHWQAQSDKETGLALKRGTNAVTGRRYRLGLKRPRHTPRWASSPPLPVPPPSIVDGHTRGETTMPRRGKPWTEEDLQFLRDHIEDMTNEEIGEKLSRSKMSICLKLNEQGILRKRGRTSPPKKNGGPGLRPRRSHPSARLPRPAPLAAAPISGDGDKVTWTAQLTAFQSGRHLADLTLSSGAHMVVEGSREEVLQLLDLLEKNGKGNKGE